MYSEVNGTKFQSYTTVQGDRWDTIATRAYGRAAQFKPIIEANPGVPLKTILPAGIKLRIPVITPAPDNTELNKLPPWKRKTTTEVAEAKAAVPTFLNPSTNLGGSFDKSFD